MKKSNKRAGITLVEILISVVMVGVMAQIVYYGIFYSYKTVARSRARLEMHGIAFDKLWTLFNMPFVDLPTVSQIGVEPTPAGSVFSTNGLVQFSVMPETNDPINWIDYWEMRVQVWAPSNSPLFSVIETNGTVTAAYDRPVVDYTVWRYRGDR